jgi:hypothetical protein
VPYIDIEGNLLYVRGDEIIEANLRSEDASTAILSLEASSLSSHFAAVQPLDLDTSFVVDREYGKCHR